MGYGSIFITGIYKFSREYRGFDFVLLDYVFILGGLGSVKHPMV